MQTTFTKEYMQANYGCYSQEHLSDCSFMQSESITLEAIVNSEIPLKDKYWFVCKKLLTKEQNQQVTIDVAEIVLPIYEKRYPDDKRPREAIEAAKQYITGHISLDTLIATRAAAYAAAYTAAYADAAAAYAAAAAAADAAAPAAYSYAADAADAYIAYTADAAIKQQLFDYLVSITTQ